MSLALLGPLIPCVAGADAEPRRTNSGLPERWIQPDTVVVLDPSLGDLGPGAEDAIKSAMQTWYADVVGIPRVTFEHGTSGVGAAFDGRSVVSAGPIAIQGHENDLAVTVTYADDATGAILEADIVFNTRYDYGAMSMPPSTCSDVYDVGAVATHESGHFFGLGEDYTDVLATMYFKTAACDAHKRVLTSFDTSAIGALYEPPDTLTAQCAAGPTSRSAAAPCIVLVVCSVGLVRRRTRKQQV